MQRFSRAILFPAAILLVVSTALPGCSWFRERPEFEGVEIAKPLEVPADLSVPRSQEALRIPSKTLVGPNASAPSAAANFVVNDDLNDVWPRLGKALGAVAGVEILKTAESIKSYEVRYGNEAFLVSAQQVGTSQTRIVAIGVDGTVKNDGNSVKLLTELRAKLR
jgi:uncharacterized lipoprotein